MLPHVLPPIPTIQEDHLHLHLHLPHLHLHHCPHYFPSHFHVPLLDNLHPLHRLHLQLSHHSLSVMTHDTNNRDLRRRLPLHQHLPHHRYQQDQIQNVIVSNSSSVSSPV